MSGNDAVFTLIAILEELEVPYMIVGSYSSNLYGIPRSTKDADLVIQFEKLDLQKLVGRLPEELSLDSQSTFEMVTATRREVVLVAGSDFKVELFYLSADAFDQTRFNNRLSIALDGQTQVWAPQAEDVVIQKLRWAKGGVRSKDFADVVSILKVQETLDFPYIEEWCAEHGTTELLIEARAEAGGA